ncbi:MAG TPA: cupin domain-containing protein [Polyangiaceae bacterium]|jgi:mannose-6-phosphate isomerase-like protein (cupin superfamily)
MRFASFLLLALTACAGAGAATAGSTATTTPPASSTSPLAGDPGTAATTASATAPPGSATPPDASPPPEPMAATLPIDLGKKVPPFPRRAVAPDKGSTVARGAVPVPEGLASQIDPTSPFFAWEEVLPPRVVLSFPKHAGLDLYVVLFDGEVSIKADDIAGKQKRLWRWNAARVPGLGAMVESKEPTRAIFVLVASAPGGTMGQAAAAGPKAGWSKRPAPVTSVELDKQPDLAWGGGAYHTRIGFEDGSASLGALMASKSAGVRPHAHDHEWEILAVLAGDGALVRTIDGREETTPIAPGTFASIAPGVTHAYRPAGTSALVAVQLYLPPGPEQRFKKLATP